ncbi:MAG TPA: pyruvate ferredoxin oxidoreductase [Candidatus Aenigmarchaeota archaeon]|nr:MAG: pyruvate ferredoxin oxidoreductase [Candidatus Aenigmarchaeota archaeon]HDD45927.1 pyruvate ferredoxin oxidoreductase [Candidatus Aenigmarchaeota archaeon]
MNFKEMVEKKERFVSGHGACAGCPIGIIVRNVLAAIEDDVVVACATGCMEVTTTIYPYTAWKVPWIHSAFENAASTMSGIVAAYEVLKEKGKINRDIRFIAFGGDGGTYDIGLQALSGAWERGHRFLYICYDNEAYMNTGNQRSGATPYGAETTTAPYGRVEAGKMEFRKNLTQIAAAHNIPYVAQASIANLPDLHNKVKKAIASDGPSFINIFSPCVLNWGYAPHKTVEISKLAVETRFWPIYEVENGKYRINYKPAKPLPIEEFLKTQRRFRYMLKEENKWMVEKLQNHINEEWEKLLKLEEISKEG